VILKLPDFFFEIKLFISLFISDIILSIFDSSIAMPLAEFHDRANIFCALFCW